MSKQMKKIIGIVVGLVVVMITVVCCALFLDLDFGDKTIADIKAEGNYTQMKADIVSNYALKESVALSIADAMFEKVGITEYNYATKDKGSHNGYILYADDLPMEIVTKGTALDLVYVGKVLIYKADGTTTSVPTTTVTYAYAQYQTVVSLLEKNLKLEEGTGVAFFETMAGLGINNFTDISSGKLNGMSGYYVYDGSMPYFIEILNNELYSIYVVCDAYEPMLAYKMGSTESVGVSTFKVLSGERTGFETSLPYKVKTITEETVIFPATLDDGDDSWLILRTPEGEYYVEVRGESVTYDSSGAVSKRTSKDYIIKLHESKIITYLKVDKKVILE